MQSGDAPDPWRKREGGERERERERGRGEERGYLMRRGGKDTRGKGKKESKQVYNHGCWTLPVKVLTISLAEITPGHGCNVVTC